MPPHFDLSLYLVTDPEMTAGRGLLETVRAAVAGGVTIVQLRDKAASARAMAETGRALLALLRSLGVPLLVNDRIDVAHAIGADGVHIGQDDLPPAAARAILGPRAIIGLSVTNADELATVDASVDYIGLGPLFPTGTKTDAAPALGEAAFSAIRRRLACPVVAIGGINRDNLARTLAAGADGVALVSAICAAPDPRAAAQELRTALAAARAHR
ncbi:MAG TPA: thiamine phosphate synthase [Opitutaceae bacterium]|nr:thiamine phosphate synthase [Opitutaceae bacterium]